MNKQELLSKQENNCELIQLIQEQSSANLKLQSEIQVLQSALMNATAQIESLTKRAASVNKTELENKKLKQLAQEAKVSVDNAKNLAQRAAERENSALKKAEQAEYERKKAEDSISEAEKSRERAIKYVKRAEKREDQTKARYKLFSMCQLIFVATVALMWLLERPHVLLECGQWFVDRVFGFVNIFKWVALSFMSTAEQDAHLAFVIFSVVIFIAVFCAVMFLIIYVFFALCDICKSIVSYYDSDSEFKVAITINIALFTFCLCITLAEPIKSVIPLNVFSVWLITAVITCGLWNLPEIIAGVEIWRDEHKR